MKHKPKFKKNDYIKNIYNRGFGIVSHIDKKGYYHFKYFYGPMFGEFKDTNTFTLQTNYDNSYELMNDGEIKKFNEMIDKQ